MSSQCLSLGYIPQQDLKDSLFSQILDLSVFLCDSQPRCTLNRNINQCYYISEDVEPILTNPPFSSQNLQRPIKTTKKRVYTSLQRKQAVSMAQKNGIDQTSIYLTIPKQNIMRWLKNKESDFQVRGRKCQDPTMEIRLNEWLNQQIQSGIYWTHLQIRKKARQLSTLPTTKFSASLGWLTKYFNRNKKMAQDYLQLKSNFMVKEEEKKQL